MSLANSLSGKPLTMGNSFIFDQPHYDALNAARETTLRSLLSALSRNLELHTAVDMGCGVGFFSNLLAGLGLKVRAVDGRSQNIAEAARRYPEIEYSVADAEDSALRSLGKFDIVLCFGL